MSEQFGWLEKSQEAGRIVFQTGVWAVLTPEEMMVWTTGYTIAHPDAKHDERIAFAWGFFHAYQDRKKATKEAGGE